MKTTKYMLLAAAAMAFAACSNDDEVGNNGPVAAQVTAGVDGVTRAYDQTWEADDAIGISTVAGDDGTQPQTSYTNMHYETTGGDGNFTHSDGAVTGIFFQDAAETVTFNAYYPFKGTEGTAAGTISDVTTETQTNQKNFDFMFAEGATASRSNPTVSFTDDAIFKHKMTRLVLNIKTDSEAGFNAGDVKNGTYSLKGLKHSGTFNTADGTATATGDASNDYWEINATPSDANNVRTYTLILYPQSNADLTFKATIGGQDYTCNYITPALAAGTSYTYTITVKKTALVVSDCTIQKWNEADAQTGDATMQ